MFVEHQVSLFDVVSGGPELGDLTHSATRLELTRGAWIDTCPGWLTGSEDLFVDLVGRVPWETERRRMYDRVVDVPRLARFYGDDDDLPNPVLAEMRSALSAHYASELQEPFTTAGLCYYRGGYDSVAWHGDTIGRGCREDTMVAIVSLGEPRTLLLRPRGGGRSLRFEVGHGDLLVMGGSCQRTWEHSVPKTARSVGPRVSIQFRPRNVR